MTAEKLTKAQRRVLEHVAGNTGKLYGSMRDFRSYRMDVVRRLASRGWLEVPRCTPTRTWEVTPAGRKALEAAP